MSHGKIAKLLESINYIQENFSANSLGQFSEWSNYVVGALEHFLLGVGSMHLLLTNNSTKVFFKSALSHRLIGLVCLKESRD